MRKVDVEISVVVPVFNRAEEVDELLDSLAYQTFKDFQVVIVEDGSEYPCDEVVNRYSDKLDTLYLTKENSGPGQSRNFGFERAKGNYAIFLDSDCVLPSHYLKTVYDLLHSNYLDAFGGPDREHQDFSALQKAINYSMTSFLTTGGIRGGGERLDKFYPRSFNMGYSREVFEKTKGFSKLRFGEDIDMSIRILKQGFSTGLIKEAFVYHKRRTKWRQFFRQVFNSGIARINLYKLHPESLKAVHFAPVIFTLGILSLMFLSVFHTFYWLGFLILHMFILFVDAGIRNKSFKIGMLSVVASYVQLLGYGMGFILAFWRRIILGKGKFAAFRTNFYD